MTKAARDECDLSPVKFSRLPKRGLMLGLNGPQLGCLGLAAISLVVGLYIGGAAPFAVSAIIWVPAAVVGLASVQGRKLVDWAPILYSWIIRQKPGSTD